MGIPSAKKCRCWLQPAAALPAQSWPITSWHCSWLEYLKQNGWKLLLIVPWETKTGVGAETSSASGPIAEVTSWPTPMYSAQVHCLLLWCIQIWHNWTKPKSKFLKPLTKAQHRRFQPPLTTKVLKVPTFEPPAFPAFKCLPIEQWQLKNSKWHLPNQQQQQWTNLPE